MKALGRWTLRQLERTRLFHEKPMLAPLLRSLWRYAWAATPEAGEAAAYGALGMGSAGRYPILFRDRHGLEYLLYPGQNDEIYLASNGNYELDETEFCLHTVQAGMTAFDVGANIGLYTLLFAKLVGPQGRVHAFEPEPRNFKRLTVNLAINGFENATANEQALAERSGQATLHVYPEAYNAWHSLARVSIHPPDEGGAAIAPEAELQVRAATLDEYCAEHGVGRIDYLKIDVEGAELGVLQGARALLERGAVGVIQFEALIKENSTPEGSSAVFDCLEGHGYTCRPIGPGGKLLPPVRRTQPDYRNYAASR